MNKIFKVLFLAFSVLFAQSFNSSLQSESFFKKLSEFNKKNVTALKNTLENFYEVEKDKLYRTKQLDTKKFNDYISQYKIKTIVNLRGENKGKKFWEDEKAVAEKNGVQFYNIPMSAVRLSSKENLINLLNIYDNAPTPILIHCQGGADRTGEAAALWTIEKQGKSNKEALNQLSIKYGHRKYKNSAKDFLINIWQGRTWLEKEYDPANYPQFKK